MQQPFGDPPDEARVTSMLATMARMQDQHNTIVHPQWRSQGFEYYRAVWVECAELLDHFGWKWWKQQTPDPDQVKLEVVDIWHFGLSDMMRSGGLEQATPALLEVVPAQGDAAAFRAAVEALAEATLRERAFAMVPFVALLSALPMPVEELFRLYVGKNVLNDFRQDHGYKSGEYRKIWAGREDNEHLIELMEGLDWTSDDVPGALYVALQGRYG